MACEPTDADVRRWAAWDDLRARQAAATTDAEQQALALEEERMRLEGIQEVAEQDRSSPGGWWWLSFADPEQGFLGVAIVPGGGVMEASLNARALGCNPGGEVKAWPLIRIPDEKYLNRLLSEEELKEGGLA